MKAVLAALLPVVMATSTGPPTTTIHPMSVTFISAKLTSCASVGSWSDVGGCWVVRIRAEFTSGAFGADETNHITSVWMSGLTPPPEPERDGDVYTWIVPEDRLVDKGGASTNYVVVLECIFSETFTFTADMTQSDTFSDTIVLKLENSGFGVVSSAGSVSVEDIVAFVSARVYEVETDAFLALYFVYNVEESVDVQVDLNQPPLWRYCPPSSEGPSTALAQNCSEAAFAMDHLCEVTKLDQGTDGFLYFPITGLEGPYDFDLVFTTSSMDDQDSALQHLKLSVVAGRTTELCSAEHVSVDLTSHVGVTFYSGVGANPPSKEMQLSSDVTNVTVDNIQGGSVKSGSLITMKVTTDSSEPFRIDLIDAYIVYDWDTDSEPGVTVDDLITGVSEFKLQYENLTASPFSCAASGLATLSSPGDCTFYHSDGPTLNANYIRAITNASEDQEWMKTTLELGASTEIDAIVDDFYTTVTEDNMGVWFIYPFADGYAKQVLINVLFEIVPTDEISGAGRRLMAASGTVDGTTGVSVRFDVSPQSFYASSHGVAEDFVVSLMCGMAFLRNEMCLPMETLKGRARLKLLQALKQAAKGVREVTILNVFIAAREAVCGEQDASPPVRRLLDNQLETDEVEVTVESLVIMDDQEENIYIDPSALANAPGMLSAVSGSSLVVMVPELPPTAAEGATAPESSIATVEAQEDAPQLPSVALGSAAAAIALALGAGVFAWRRRSTGEDTKLKLAKQGAGASKKTKIHPAPEDEVEPFNNEAEVVAAEEFARNGVKMADAEEESGLMWATRVGPSWRRRASPVLHEPLEVLHWGEDAEPMFDLEQDFPPPYGKPHSAAPPNSPLHEPRIRASCALSNSMSKFRSSRAPSRAAHALRESTENSRASTAAAVQVFSLDDDDDRCEVLPGCAATGLRSTLGPPVGASSLSSGASPAASHSPRAGPVRKMPSWARKAWAEEAEEIKSFAPNNRITFGTHGDLTAATLRDLDLVNERPVYRAHALPEELRAEAKLRDKAQAAANNLNNVRPGPNKAVAPRDDDDDDTVAGHSSGSKSDSVPRPGSSGTLPRRTPSWALRGTVRASAESVAPYGSNNSVRASRS